MTTPSTPRKAGPLLGTGAQTSWPFTFKVFAASDIAVTIANNLGVETALVLNADYSVTLNSNQDTSPGGTVTYPISGAALPTGSKLTIFGNLPYDQPLDLPSGGNFSPLALENQLDRLTMQIQQLREQLGRSLQVSVTSSANVALPPPAASNLIGWNENGDNFENYPLSELATSLAFATYRYDTFTGNGSTTQFTLSADPVTLGNLDVAVGGVTQTPGADYLLVGGVLEFTSAPPLGATILARFGEGIASGPSMDSYDVRFRQAGTGALDRTAEAKMRETVSVFDFLPPAQVALIVANNAAGQNPTVITAAIQAALDSSLSVYFPAGTYLVNDTIRKDVPRPTFNRLFGAGKYATTIKASPSMMNKPIFHFGDLSGHGSPQVELVDLGFNGHDKTNGNTAVFLQEGGICHLANIAIRYCGIGIDGTAATDTLIDGDNYIEGCEIGARFLPSPVAGPSNEVRIRNVWFTDCNQAVFAEGDFIEISGCTSQSCGIDGTKHVFEVNNSALPGFAFFGAKIFNNWIEGGFNKYCIAVIGCPSAIVYNNLMFGQGGLPQADREGGILIDNCANADVNHNVVYQFFTRPPQDGRLANAGIYVKNSTGGSRGGAFRCYHNTLYRDQSGNQYYFEGLSAPTLSKDAYQNSWALVTISGGVATVVNGKNIGSVVNYGGAGYWQVNLPYNRESINTMVFVQPNHSTALFSSVSDNGPGSVRLRFFDAAGVATDPDIGFSIMFMTENAIN